MADLKINILKKKASNVQRRAEMRYVLHVCSAPCQKENEEAQEGNEHVQ